MRRIKKFNVTKKCNIYRVKKVKFLLKKRPIDSTIIQKYLKKIYSDTMVADYSFSSANNNLS